MSDGRTYWWALDAAWFRRERQADLALMHGPVGVAALLWLCCHAKELNDAGVVKSGYSAVAQGIGGKVEEVTGALRYAAEIGALDDFEEDGKRFTARISGWSSDQEKALGAMRSARYRDRHAASRSVTPSNAESLEQRQEQEQSTTAIAVDALRANHDGIGLLVAESLIHVAEVKQVKPFTAAAIASVIGKYGDRDHVAEAEAFEAWHTTGVGENGQVRDLVRAWGNWLKRAPSSDKRNAPRRGGKPQPLTADHFTPDAEAKAMAQMHAMLAGEVTRRAGSTSDQKNGSAGDGIPISTKENA